MPQFNKWRKASIYNLEHEHICDVAVQERKEDIILIFPEEIKKGSWEDVSVVFYDDVKGLVTYKCKLTDYNLMSMGLTAKCILGEEESAVQRRNDLKIRQIIPISIQTVDTVGKKISVDATIHDISAGGLFCVSEHIFAEGDRFSFLFRRAAKPLRLECEVLRKQPYEPKGSFNLNQMMGYGCRFVNMNDNMESLIRSYVFKEDLLMKKRERMRLE